LQKYGCVICCAIGQIEFDLLAQLQGTSEGSVLALISAGAQLGFCNLHLCRLRQLMSVRTAAPFLLKVFEKLISTNATTFHEPCYICDFLNKVKQELLQQLLLQLENPALRKRYAAGDGVCLPHLRMLLASEILTAEMQDFLIREQRESISRLLPLLQALCSKSYSLTDNFERSSIMRGVQKLVGGDGLI